MQKSCSNREKKKQKQKNKRTITNLDSIVVIRSSHAVVPHRVRSLHEEPYDLYGRYSHFAYSFSSNDFG